MDFVEGLIEDGCTKKRNGNVTTRFLELLSFLVEDLLRFADEVHFME